MPTAKKKNTTCTPLLLLLTAAAMIPHKTTGLTERYKPNEWYTKYGDYPEYCSRPMDMYYRKIPPLQTTQHQQLGETRLVHVTAVIRHGARTPWSSQQSCWAGYWNSTRDTGVWDCDLTTFMASPDPQTVPRGEPPASSNTTTTASTSTSSPQSSKNQDDQQPDPNASFFLFEKVYDALNSGEEGALTNELHGTCQKGQMLLQGYEQQIQNGRILRRAYGYYEGDFDHDERMRLLDLTYHYQSSIGEKTAKLPWDRNRLYFRADDDQRTVMSGQVLLRGLFDEEVMEMFTIDGIYPNIVVHTADRERDVLDANVHICPRLAEIEQAAKQSDEYQAFNNSDQMEALRWFARDKLGATGDLHFLDCLMTTICTDRDLPDAVNDYYSDTPVDDGVAGGKSKHDSMFRALAQVDIQSFNLIMKYNNSEYAKLGMGPLWAEIWDNIDPWLNQYDSPESTPGPKLALYSGHDSTIMPLLASLDAKLWNDTDWPAYASMVLIEIHELIDGRSNTEIYSTGFAFRLLYNGKILTPLVPGCHVGAELCDTVHLKALVDPIATRNPYCDVVSVAQPSSSEEVMVQAQTLLNTTQGIFMFLGLVVFGIILGAICTFILLTGRLPCTQRQVLDKTEVEEDREARQGLQSNTDAFFDEPIPEEDEDEDLGGKDMHAISTGFE